MATNEKVSKNDGEEKEDGLIYRSMISSLMYLIDTTPDTVRTVNIVFRIMKESIKTHFAAVKTILRCIKGGQELGSSILG